MKGRGEDPGQVSSVEAEGRVPGGQALSLRRRAWGGAWGRAAPGREDPQGCARPPARKQRWGSVGPLPWLSVKGGAHAASAVPQGAGPRCQREPSTCTEHTVHGPLQAGGCHSLAGGGQSMEHLQGAHAE